MTKTELIQWLSSRGYIEYRLGWWAKEKPSKPIAEGFRHYRLTNTMLRLEIRSSHGSWIKIRSGYINQLSINEKNQLKGMR
ncbi:MAG: hypothetical protein ABFD50_07940 [Smithella sp.]